MYTIHKGKKAWAMLVYFFLACFLLVKSVHGLTLRQINDKLGYIEDRINAESKFRRDDYNSLFSEITSLKEMLVSYGTKIEEKGKMHTGQTKEDVVKDLVEKVHRLTVGFKEEKTTNALQKRKTHELYKQVSNLNNVTKRSADAFESLLRDVEMIQIRLDLLQEELSDIKRDLKKFTDASEQTKVLEKERIDILQIYIGNLTGNIQQLNARQNVCLEKVNIAVDGIQSNEEKYVNKETNDKDHKACTCSNASLSIQGKSCMDLYNNEVKSNGIYQINIGEEKPLSVYCDMETDGGGWTVFQRRQDGSVNFFRDWEAYKYGFGNLSSEFWLGNKYLNLLTDDDQNHELRIDLEDFKGNHAYAKYSNFKVKSETMKFKLEIHNYTGTAGDSVKTPSNELHAHDNMEFSTKDNDNDKTSTAHCAFKYKGGWWFNSCFDSHLNGLYSQEEDCEKHWECIIWFRWKGSKTSIKFTEMKLR